MTSLSFPDVNVWLALLLEDHPHRPAALRWWDTGEIEAIAFCRFTQIALLRLLTTSAAMGGRPLPMPDAWKAYDRLFDDERVLFMAEPSGIEPHFRRRSSLSAMSPKVWADAYLAAFARAANGVVVTFDQAFPSREVSCLVLQR